MSKSGSLIVGLSKVVGFLAKGMLRRKVSKSFDFQVETGTPIIYLRIVLVRGIAFLVSKIVILTFPRADSTVVHGLGCNPQCTTYQLIEYGEAEAYS